MQFSMKDEVVKFTTVNNRRFDLFSAMERKLIDHCFHEALMSKENVTSIDLEFGRLIIKLDCDEIKYKFVPSVELEKSLRKTIKDDSEELVRKVEQEVSERMFELYEELI